MSTDEQMRAWQLVAANRPLVRTSIPRPKPGPGEVVLDLRAAGMCHSDVGFWNGTLTDGLDHMPIVLGHENAGVISAVGTDVQGFSVGDRVTAYPIEAHPYAGTERDGGYADQTVLPAAGLVRIPHNVSFEQAAAASDAGMTSFHAVHASGRVVTGTRVGIIGLGGLGMAGAWFSVLAGAEVYAADTNEDVHDRALSLGVTNVFADADDFGPLDLDVIIDFVGANTTVLAAVRSVKVGGRVVLVGLESAEFTLPSMLFASQQAELVGSWGGTRQDIADVLSPMADERFDIPATIIDFEEIGQSLEDMATGQLLGKVVARIGE